MNLDPSEKRRVWWKGAFKAAAVGLLIGAAVGLVAAGGLYGLCAMAPELFAAVAPLVGYGTSFSPLLLTAFSGVISGVTGLFTGGGMAVAAYHQQKHNQRDEQKLVELDGRTRVLEQFITPGHATQAILAYGPRHKTSFVEAETARSDAPAHAPTIH